MRARWHLDCSMIGACGGERRSAKPADAAMLDFLWHLRGSVKLGASNDAVLDRIENLLDRQRKPISQRSDDYIIFDDPLWRNPLGSNWLAMAMYDRGRVWIEHGIDGRRLRYDLRSLHVLIFCLAVFPTFFAVAAVGGADRSEIINMLRFAALGFCWLYGINLLLALLRVPRAIRKAVTRGVDTQK